MLSHNGEINTIKGNVNWMAAHETRMVSGAFEGHHDALFPLIPSGASDSEALDTVFEALVHAGREVPLVKLLLVPDAWSNKTEMPEAHRALFAYCNCVMEPWDGPAALAVTDGRWILAGMDRAGLRPMRYTVTAAGLLLVGSERAWCRSTKPRWSRRAASAPARWLPSISRQGAFITTANSRTGSPPASPTANGSKTSPNWTA